MRNLFLLCSFTLVCFNISAQKIIYSSNKNFQNVRLAVKYPSQTKTIVNKESVDVAIVQSPMLAKRRQIYGALAEKK